MARINIIFREIETGKVLNQANNLEGSNLMELDGKEFDKRLYDLLERTSHRLYGPNGMVVLTAYKAKGKDAGYHAVAGHKVRGRPHLFSNARKVIITLESEGKVWHRPLTSNDSDEQVPVAAETAAAS